MAMNAHVWASLRKARTESAAADPPVISTTNVCTDSNGSCTTVRVQATTVARTASRPPQSTDSATERKAIGIATGGASSATIALPARW